MKYSSIVNVCNPPFFHDVFYDCSRASGPVNSALLAVNGCKLSNSMNWRSFRQEILKAYHATSHEPYFQAWHHFLEFTKPRPSPYASGQREAWLTPARASPVPRIGALIGDIAPEIAQNRMQGESITLIDRAGVKKL